MRHFHLQAALAAGLTFCATAEWLAGSKAATPPALAVAQATAPNRTMAVVLTPRLVAVILARPLFSAGRRPLAVPAPVVDETPPQLSAIVITAAGRSAIMIGPDGAPAVLVVGGEIGAYQLRGISPDHVSLLGPNGPVTIYPQYAPADAAPAGAAPATPAPVARHHSNGAR